MGDSAARGTRGVVGVPQKNRLLYYMDRGMLLHLAGSYEASNQSLELAKKTAEALWTESIGAHAASWATTDNALPYQGEDFEKVMLHLVAALNYLAMGKISQAEVEARQITAKLELYNQQLGEASSVYRDDAIYSDATTAAPPATPTAFWLHASHAARILGSRT